MRYTSSDFARQEETQFKSGDRVIWDYPVGWGYIETHFPLVVTKVVGDIAYLDLPIVPVPIRELAIAV